MYLFIFRVNKRKKTASPVKSKPTATVTSPPAKRSTRTSTRTSGQLGGSPNKIAKIESSGNNRVFEYVIEEVQANGVTTTTQIEAIDPESSEIILSLNNSANNVISMAVDEEQKPVPEIEPEVADEEYSMDSVSLAKSVKDLLDLLVDSATLKKFGWPNSPVEYVSIRFNNFFVSISFLLFEHHTPCILNAS